MQPCASASLECNLYAAARLFSVFFVLHVLLPTSPGPAYPCPQDGECDCDGCCKVYPQVRRDGVTAGVMKIEE